MGLDQGDIPAGTCSAQLVTYSYTTLQMEPRAFRMLANGAAGEKAPLLRALGAPVEDKRSVPDTHVRQIIAT